MDRGTDEQIATFFSIFCIQSESQQDQYTMNTQITNETHRECVHDKP